MRSVLILDGLDKDDWIKYAVVDGFSRVNNSRHMSDLMRCLISSREGYDCSIGPSDIRWYNLNNEPGVKGDVLRFAESRLADMYPTSANARHLLTSFAKKICLQAEGVFLWVALVIENLRPTASLAELETELLSLPPTIEGLYQQILRKIPSQKTEIVQRAFAWVIAANRPLELAELIEALAIEVDPHGSPAIATLASHIWNTQCSEDELLRICGPLIIIRENTVRFRHQSVRTHLLSDGETGIWGTSTAKAHTLLAETCLGLLTPRQHERPLLRTLRRPTAQSHMVRYGSKMKGYAATNWSFHYGLVESHSNRLVSMLHHLLTLTLHDDCERFSLHERGPSYQIETSILSIAACHGFVSLTRVSLEMGINPDGHPCDSCETPLALAAAGGHSQVAVLLLQRGASTIARSPGSGQTALHLAAASGSQDIVNMLLSKGADPEPNADYLGRTPLHVAASSRSVEIIKLLLDHGGDINAVIPASGETPLHLAASRGHLRAVVCLVEGLDVSEKEMNLYDSMVQQRYYQTWTEDLLTTSTSNQDFIWGVEARFYAQETVTELVSTCGRYIDINARTRQGRTALHLAAGHGHLQIVRFLIQNGINVDLVDNDACTALRLAAQNGHLDTVKSLLATSAGFNKDVHQLGVMLKSVTNNGHDTVANLLVWNYFSAEVLGKPCQVPVLALAKKSKQNTVRDAIRNKNPHDRSTLRSQTAETQRNNKDDSVSDWNYKNGSDRAKRARVPSQDRGM